MSEAAIDGLKGITILVAEDEVFIGLAVEQALREAGADKVDLATNIAEMGENLAGAGYHAVVLDLRLADGETFDIGTQLSDCHVPLVIHSGHADMNHSQRLPNAVFCAKPSKPQDSGCQSKLSQQRRSVLIDAHKKRPRAYDTCEASKLFSV